MKWFLKINQNKNLNDERELFLRPSKIKMKEGLYKIAFLILIIINILIMLLIELEIIPVGPIFGIPICYALALILTIIILIIISIDIIFRIEASVSKLKIVFPIKRLDLFKSIDRKMVYWGEINSIHIQQNYIEIETNFNPNKYKIHVNPKEFQEIINTKFPNYKSKIKIEI